MRGPLAIGPLLLRRARAEDAELVGLGIGHDDPTDLALADIDPPGAERDEPLHFRVLVVGTQVEVDAVLHRLAFRDLQKEDVGAIAARLDPPLTILGAVQLEAERLAPEGRDEEWIGAVDHDVLPAKGHLCECMEPALAGAFTMTADHESDVIPASGERELRHADGELAFANKQIEILNRQLASLQSGRSAQVARIVSRTASRAVPVDTVRRRIIAAPLRSVTALWSGDVNAALHSWDPDAAPRLAAADRRWNRFCARHEPNLARLRTMRERARAWPDRPLVSILLPTYEPNAAYLRAAIESVVAQAYDRWELCIVDDGSPSHVAADVVATFSGDARIRFTALPVNGGIAASSQAAASMATGDCIALLDHDDVLRPHALFEMVRYLRAYPTCDFVYSDEDKLDPRGRRVSPFLKPDWSPELLESCNYITHLTLIRRTLFDRAGGFRPGFDGSQDYDLFLRCTEVAEHIGHVREVLYSWRMHEGSAAGNEDAKPHAYTAAIRSLEERLERTGGTGTVRDGAWRGLYRISRPVIGSPSVTAIVIARAGAERVRAAVACLEREAGDRDVRVVIVDAGSVDTELRGSLEQCGHQVVADPENAGLRPRMVNAAVAAAGPSDHVLLFSEHIALGRPGWLDALLEYSQLPDAGVVGARLLDDDSGAPHDGVRVGSRGMPRENVDLSAYLGMGLATRTVTAVNSDCLLVKRSLWNSFGGLDAAYATDYADLDLCVRLTRAGHRNVQHPDAELFIRAAPEVAPPSADDVRLFTSRWGPFTQGYDRYFGGHILSFSPLDFR
jgi:glycosyltransferase involved in cell wall biosynthesis